MTYVITRGMGVAVVEVFDGALVDSHRVAAAHILRVAWAMQLGDGRLSGVASSFGGRPVRG
jgi:hypothetical protein